MKYKDIQETINHNGHEFNNPQEIMLAATEELGEVAQEVALLEKIGTKANWDKKPSKDRLSKEIKDTINCLITLANHYKIDLDE
jgi:NTP pyrophosphatase (non-canonical NTP hydrolase)